MTFFRACKKTVVQWTVLALATVSLGVPLSAVAGQSTKASSGKHRVQPAAKKSAVSVAKKVKPRGEKTVALKTGARQSSQVRTAKYLAQLDRRGPKRAENKSREVARLSTRRLSRAERVAEARRSKQTLRQVALRRPVTSARLASVHPRQSNGERMGLRSADDPLELNSSVALVVDQQTQEVLFSKNDSAVLPIASLTKLMTGLVITDAHLPMEEMLTITADDVDTFKGSRSRLAVGTTLTRRELMHLALMSSENRAAHALGRTFPGGLDHFVREMNAKARELGMRDTRYVEPTGLSSYNQSSARDLATLVSVAYQRPILRSLSTSPSHMLDLGHRTLEFRNSNGLIRDPEWEIGLQKTGYISEAGRCLVMQAKVAGRQLIMVFLDSAGKISRAQDAERVRRWVEAQSPALSLTRPQG
jgi:serine-type D-Ala-D-Ala endopeptidase (penicillin-binding protein 7)